jgi:arsenate reductase (thioredoxin)
MGCGDACPVFLEKRYLGRDLPDPAGLTIEQVRPIRDEISARVRTLLGEMRWTGTGRRDGHGPR